MASAIVAASRPRRGSLRVSTVAAGPPTVTTSMYTVTSCPAADTDTARSAAISGSSPTSTNSAVATANEQSMSTTINTSATLKPDTDVRVKPCRSES